MYDGVANHAKTLKYLAAINKRAASALARQNGAAA
jgi:hypothetical protein